MTATTPIRRLTIHIAYGLALFVTTTGAALANTAATTPFIGHFKVSRSGLGLGTAKFHLRPGDKPGCYVYTGRADPNALAKMFIGRITEKSRFCMRDGQIRPQYFKHHIDGAKDDSFTLNFDWSKHVVRYENEQGQTRTMRFDDQVLDPLSLQIAARRWLMNAQDPSELGTRTFTLVDENKIKPYQLKVTPAPDISVPAGTFQVLKLKRTNDNHPLTFWLSKKHDWIPVRVHKSAGSSSYQMDINKLIVDGANAG
ncbi:DUF3108 domain-containing protein [Salinisphaera sp. USBA-960]|uniref:DUF3108 domain-containing protein n=1 Tax=Salinisphaera orenii TaxID=856731 RepID=UPI000DBE8055|nr:DUF3108 domain-containing protein [Salifodinibacter halophilus]NNC26623.1 DUF3108 domain-containing protein [Salifodinibacter halophilus]